MAESDPILIGYVGALSGDTALWGQAGLNGMPYNYFKYGSRGVEFYPNGNGNGMPTFYFKFRGANAVEVYPNGNGNGMPEWYFEKRGRMVLFYPNGNGNGFPIYSFDDVNDVRDVIEWVFYLYIPH